MHHLGFLSKYIMATSVYALVRKPFILKKHKVETSDSNLTRTKYRPLLSTEVAMISAMNCFVGPIFTPIFIAADLNALEISVRKLDKEEHYSKKYYENRTILDLMFV